MSHKETLNLPKTGFPMKGNLPAKEPEIQKYWDSIDLYSMINDATANRPAFLLHDGPPYANGDVHVGTAYNKIIKDIIIKYKTMRGYHCPYVPGWDCHGQPIEHEVTKRIGPDARIGRVDLRKICRDYAMKYVKRQSEQFQRLGVLGDFKDPYLTLSPDYEATNIEVFEELYLKGLIFKGKKPIHWCPSCVTALAEAEIEYHDKESYSVFVRFPLVDEFPPLTQAGKPVSLLVWTTTPWTLPANVAVALHPRLDYTGVDTGEEILVVALPLVCGVTEELSVGEYETIDTFGGSEMEGLECSHPWFDRDSVIVLADYVTLEQGTGCVHIAPGHGQEDYLTGLEYDLPNPMPVDDYGYFTDEAGPFAGMSLDEANPEIIRDLERKNLLLSSGKVTHQYPHCWRCQKPVVFRATPQWFIALDGEIFESTLRKISLDSIENVRWIPEWTINRIKSMVESRPDWCISRQRAWGVPLPILYCKDCGREFVTEKSLEAIRELIAREGADSWFEHDPGDFLPEEAGCSYCGGRDFEKESDIFDVWFESGISHLAVLRERRELDWPADLYVEGSDQHRGWFQSSLLASIGYSGEPPYRTVLTHGFTVDGDGRKMSKSLGNAIDPLDVCQHYGADILRLWTAATDYSSDMPISGEILDRITESYRRIRNTLRFLLGNCHDFDPSADSVPQDRLEEIDRFMLSKLQSLISRVTDLMDRYLFHQALQALQLYCTVDLSSLYLDILKDRLYTFPANSTGRRSAQTVISTILENLNIMIAPFLAFTAEEAWSVASDAREPSSVHLASWPEADESLVDVDLEQRWERIVEIRDLVYGKIEESRQKGELGTSLEAKVLLSAGGRTLSLLQEISDLLPAAFIVSQVEVSSLIQSGAEEPPGDLVIKIERASGDKCQRCWNYSAAVGKDKDNPDICERCVVALEEIGRY